MLRLLPPNHLVRPATAYAARRTLETLQVLGHGKPKAGLNDGNKTESRNSFATLARPIDYSVFRTEYSMRAHVASVRDNPYVYPLA